MQPFATVALANLTLALDTVGVMTAHVACKHHKEHAELQRTCPSVSSVFKQKETRPSVSSVFKQKETPLVLKTTRVEALLVTTLADSNLLLLAADKFMKTLKEMFPDLEIA